MHLVLILKPCLNDGEAFGCIQIVKHPLCPRITHRGAGDDSPMSKTPQAPAVRVPFGPLLASPAGCLWSSQLYICAHVEHQVSSSGWEPRGLGSISRSAPPTSSVPGTWAGAESQCFLNVPQMPTSALSPVFLQGGTAASVSPPSRSLPCPAQRTLPDLSPRPL